MKLFLILIFLRKNYIISLIFGDTLVYNTIIFASLLFALLLIFIFIWIWKKIITLFKYSWYKYEFYPGIFYLFIYFKLHILYIIHALELTGPTNYWSIVLRISISILSLLIFYPLMDKKISKYYIIYIIMFSIIIVPNLNTIIIFGDLLISYISYITIINPSIIMKVDKTVFLEHSVTGKLTLYGNLKSLVHKIAMEHIKSGKQTSKIRIEYELNRASKTSKPINGYYIHIGRQQEVHTKMATPYVKSSLENDNSLLGTFIFYSMNESARIINLLSNDLQKNFDSSKIYALDNNYHLDNKEPDIPELTKENKIHLFSLIKINIYRAIINPKVRKNDKHIATMLDHLGNRIDGNNKNISYTISLLIQKHLYTSFRSNPEFEIYFAEDRKTIRWSELVYDNSTLFIRSLKD